jgi:aquaporin Z
VAVVHDRCVGASGERFHEPGRIFAGPQYFAILSGAVTGCSSLGEVMGNPARKKTGGVASGEQDRSTSRAERTSLTATGRLQLHWPEYLMEAGELAIYMFATCLFATLLQHPASPVRHAIQDDVSRRALMGLAIGATVIAMILSPWGQQSGGHFNPALTFAFFRLGKLEPWDALFYLSAQLFGAIAGVAIAKYVLRGAPGNEAVRYAVTAPGMYGKTVAFVAESAISFTLMTTILFVSNRQALARYTPFFVGALYAVFITIEMPLSGMSMNPARTLGSALHASYFHTLWIYFVAPTLGMLMAAEVFLHARGGVGPYCAKLNHANNKRCIFRHGSSTTQALHV